MKQESLEEFIEKEEETKCYCGHTTTCDCGPEETKQECMITKIMQMDAKMAYDSLPKQETLSGFEEGHKANLDWLKQNSNQTKQESLEEFIEKEGYPKGVTQEIWEQGVREGANWQKNQYTIEEQHVEHSIGDLEKEYIKGFNEGAKWQQEQGYSEEEVIAFGEFIFKHSLLTHTIGVNSLFEQFKKK